MLSDIGGSMGPLYGTFFTEMAEALEGVDRILAVVTDVMPSSERKAGFDKMKKGGGSIKIVLVPE